MKWISAGDIKNWSSTNQRDCASLLPELLRRLILATSVSVEDINFPSGDSISTSGWDGSLRCETSSPFFPTGVSAWELGVKNSPGKKADEDYKKRTNNSNEMSINETTFVFVTPRSWPGRQKWITEKKAEKKWKDVKVISADTLEQWLEISPVVSMWLANHLGKTIDGVMSIEGYWEEWSTTTTPNMTSKLVIAGRDNQVKIIHGWIKGQPNILSFQGDSPDEPIAFLYGAIDCLSEIEKIKYFSKCVFTDSLDQMRHLINFKNPLIIATSIECNDLIGLALKKGHHVYLSSGTNITNVGNTTVLIRPKLESIKTELRNQGLSEIESKKLSHNSGRSITVLKRRMSTSPIITNPVWNNQVSTHLLLPILFVAAWNESKDGDIKIIEKLSGKSYQSYLNDLQNLLVVDDSPLRKIGNVWMLKSSLDVWHVLAVHINSGLLDKYKEVFMDVFSKIDPKYNLPSDKRWAASVYGKSNMFSTWLRNGLSESLALMSVYHEQAVNYPSLDVFINQLVKDLICSIKDWKMLASLDDFMPWFAESSPESFLKEINNLIKVKPSIFKELMRDDDDFIFGECKHSGLLWAIESLAWDPVYFTRAVEILIKLSKLDPGGRYSNRPINTLTDIFLPRWPQTNTLPKDRINLLDKYINSDSKLVWKFTKNYLLEGTFSESHKFYWRSYKNDRGGFEIEPDSSVYINELIPKLKKIACRKINIIDVLDEFTRLDRDIQQSIIKTLKRIKKDSFTKKEKETVFNMIREAMNWINSYGDDSIRKLIPDLDYLLKKFESDNLLDKNSWLFDDYWPRLPDGDNKDYVKNEEEITLRRNKVVREYLDKLPIEEIVDYTSSSRYPGLIGKILGDVVKNGKEDNLVLDGLLEKNENNLSIIPSYANSRIKICGEEWVKKQIRRLKLSNRYAPETHALLLSGMPENRSTWLLAKKEGKEVESLYWKYSKSYCTSKDNDDIQYFVEKLISVKRFKDALSVAGSDNKISIPSILLKQVILGMLSEKENLKADAMMDYYLSNVFLQLYERKELSDEEISKLEWPFAALFKEIYCHNKKPFAIYKVLERNPELFSDLIKMIYKRDDGKVDSKNSEKIARNAKIVLDGWGGIPGTKDNGEIDVKVFNNWIKKARSNCAASFHKRGGDLQIATILSHSPYDPDGIWPHTVVRNIIENLDNDIINQHIPFAIFNNRGGTFREIDGGGNQERELFQRYEDMSQKLNLRWPVTASILHNIADFYKHEAKREDVDADLNDIRWG